MVYLHYEIELLRFAADCSSINTQVLKDWSKCEPFKNYLNLNFTNSNWTGSYQIDLSHQMIDEW